MTPVVSFVASSGAGKTTLLIKIIAELTARGVRLGTVKHTHHELEFHQKGKDSAKHAEAGAVQNALSAPNGMSFATAAVWALNDILALFRDVDLIIVEGYKHEPKPKIEVLRAAHSRESVVHDAPNLIAVVSDFEYLGGLPHFALDDVGGICDFIQRRFLA